eukprot:759364-Hanusia_phi.AAC.2
MERTTGKRGWKTRTRDDKGLELKSNRAARPWSSLGLSSKNVLATETELSVYNAAMKSFPTKEQPLSREKLICKACPDGHSVYEETNPKEEPMAHKHEAEAVEDRGNFKRTKGRARRRMSSKEENDGLKRCHDIMLYDPQNSTDPRVEIKKNHQAMRSVLDKLNELTDVSSEDLSRSFHEVGGASLLREH